MSTSQEKSSLRSKHDALMDLDDLNRMESKTPYKEKAEEPMEGSVEPDEDATEKLTPVRRVNEFGKFKGLTMSALGGISAMMLPPFTKRKVAIYELLTKDQIDPLTGQPPDLSDVVIPGRIVVRDRFEKDPLRLNKILKYITKTEIVVVDGKDTLKEHTEDIKFINGKLAVPVAENYLLYVIMELHPMNQSNRNRPSSEVEAAFRRQDMDRKNWAQTMTAMDLAYEAEQTVVNLTKEKDVLAYATALGIPSAGRRIDGDESIKHDLRVFARTQPVEFFKVVKNNAAAVKLQVMDAVNMGLVEWDIDTKRWTFTNDGASICTILATEDPTQGLIKALLREENLEAYKRLTEYLNYWSE